MVRPAQERTYSTATCAPSRLSGTSSPRRTAPQHTSPRHRHKYRIAMNFNNLKGRLKGKQTGAPPVYTPRSPPIALPTTRPTARPPQMVAPSAPRPAPVAITRKLPVLPDRLIVGIDFGTTYSGVAYVLATGQNIDNLKPNNISEWIGQGNMSQSKIETVLYYDSDGNVVGWSLDSDDCMNGAGKLKPGIYKAEWFKMHLQADSVNTYVHTGDLPKLPPNKTALDVASDYLTLLHKAIDAELLKRLSGVYEREKNNIRYFLTVPAIWNDAGKNLTRQAAVRAGFVDDINDRRLKLITEPEAAAVYCARYSQLSLQASDVFLIVDCGGGTVDLVAYEVEETLPFTVKECTVPTGDACGATRVLAAFEQIALDKIGKIPLDNADGNRLRAKFLDKCLRDFDNRIKKSVKYKNPRDFLIELGSEFDCPEASVTDGQMAFTSDEIAQAFSQVVERTVELVKDQINLVESQQKKLEAIMVVGGFGASQYLFDYIKEHIPPKYVQKLVRPVDSVAAIVQGAVTTGIFDRVVTSRKSRRHYMLETVELFVPGRHPEEFRLRGYDGVDRCRSTRKIFIEKWQKLVVGQPVTVHLRRQIDVNGNPVFKDSLYYCEQDKCPEFVTMSGIVPLATLHMDLSSVDKSLFRMVEGSDGRKMYDIEFEVSMSLEDGDALRAECTFKNQIVGQATVDFK
ncbi:uncharacterized protein V1518DRAFT_409146 [Limtongia smithiae]|uniref:uncharacterized protein n=1 Tax=Limtongia smithiae TaxID=1125753 RepID=UPI0034CF8D7F